MLIVVRRRLRMAGSMMNQGWWSWNWWWSMTEWPTSHQPANTWDVACTRDAVVSRWGAVDRWNLIRDPWSSSTSSPQLMLRPRLPRNWLWTTCIQVATNVSYVFYATLLSNYFAYCDVTILWSVCLSVCHVCTLCSNGIRYGYDFFCIRQPHISPIIIIIMRHATISA